MPVISEFRKINCFFLPLINRLSTVLWYLSGLLITPVQEKKVPFPVIKLSTDTCHCESWRKERYLPLGRLGKAICCISTSKSEWSWHKDKITKHERPALCMWSSVTRCSRILEMAVVNTHFQKDLLSYCVILQSITSKSPNSAKLSKILLYIWMKIFQVRRE